MNAQPSLEQLESALIAADKAGDTEAATLLANALRQHSYPEDPYTTAIQGAAAIGSGIVAEPLSGYAGIAGSVLPGPPGQGADWVERTREAMTYQPTQETAQRALQGLGETLAPVGEGFEQAGDFFAERGSELLSPFGETGKAIGHTMGKSVPTAVAELAGLGAVSRVPKAAAKLPKTPRIDPRVEGIQRGDRDTAKLELDERGKVKRSKTSREALYQGMEPGMLAAVKAAKPVDKKSMLKMLDIVGIGRKNRRAGATIYPSSVAGKSIAKRYNHVAKVNRDAGKRIDGVAKFELRGKTVDYAVPVDNFIASMDEMGIGFKDGKLNFKGSDAQGLGGNEAVLNRVVKWMREADRTDAYAVHRLKRYLDENINYGASQEGVTARVQGALRGLRHELDGLLDDAFPEYKKVNETYSETITVLNDFQSAVASKIDFKGPNLERSLGIEARKLLSNYASGTTQLNGLEALTKIANKYGGKFDDDVVMQTMFYVELQRLFPETFRTTFKSEIQKAAEAAIKGGPVDAAKNAVLEKGIELAMGTRGEDELLKALQQLLAESP